MSTSEDRPTPSFSRRSFGTFTAVGFDLYGLAPDHSKINRYVVGQEWETVGAQPAGWIWARGDTLLATNPSSGNVFRYTDGSWSQIGTPGADVAPDAFGNIYALAPDRSGLYRYLGRSNWEQVGGAAAQVVCT